MSNKFADDHEAVYMATTVYVPHRTGAMEWVRLFDPEHFFTRVINNRDLQEFYDVDKWAALAKAYNEEIQRYSKEHQ